MLRRRHETLQEELLREAQAKGGIAAPPRPLQPTRLPAPPARSYERDRRAYLLWEYGQRAARMSDAQRRRGRLMTRLGVVLCAGFFLLGAVDAPEWTGIVGPIGLLTLFYPWLVLERPPWWFQSSGRGP